MHPNNPNKGKLAEGSHGKKDVECHQTLMRQLHSKEIKQGQTRDPEIAIDAAAASKIKGR